MHLVQQIETAKRLLGRLDAEQFSALHSQDRALLRSLATDAHLLSAHAYAICYLLKGHIRELDANRPNSHPGENPS